MERISEAKILDALVSVIKGRVNKQAVLNAFPAVNEALIAIVDAQLEADKAEHERVVREMLKGIWDMFHTHGIGVLGEAKGVMDVTISHKEQGKLTTNVTFSRPAEDGILSWLPDNEWKDLKSKYEGK